MDDLIPIGPKIIQPPYMGITLEIFLYNNHNEPDDTLVEIFWAPWSQRTDGFYGPPRISIGRLREEWLLRGAFPHQAQTTVW